MYTIQEILDIAEISQFIAKDNESIGMLFRGGYERVGLSRLIYIVRDSVQWLYDYNSSNSTLLGKANYLFSLCQPFVGRALQIIGSGGTGTIINPATGVISTILARNIEFKIGDDDSPMDVGDTVLALNYSFILNESISVYMDGVDLPVGATDRISFNPIYGLLTSLVTFNQPVESSQLYSVRFLQYINI